MTKFKIYRLFLLTMVSLVFSNASVIAQDIIIQQSITGESRTDVRGQVFVPSEFGTGVGDTFGQATVYLNTLSVYYAGATQTDKLYIYETLPTTTTDLDAGTGGVLIGESFVNKTESGKTTYHFGSLELGTNTAYYAVFREDVDLSFGEDAAATGPYAGGKMLVNNGTAVVENDFTALQFSAELSLSAHVNQGDLEALIALYEATDGSIWDLTGDPLEWSGTTWDGTRLIQLSIGELVGYIPDEIGELTELTFLNLFANTFSGGIPASIGKLTKLQTLVLRNSKLTGSIPDELGNLVNLEKLLLHENNLTGDIPISIAGLTNLWQIWLFSNELTGLPQEVYDMASLSELQLDNNKLSQLPILNLSSSFLDVTNNDLVFDSFEKNIDVINDESNNVRYFPQNYIPSPKAVVKSIGDTHTFTVSVGGSENRYQWLKQGIPITEISTNPSYTISSIEEEDYGLYNCTITNTIVSELTLNIEGTVLTHQTEFINNTPEIDEVNAASVRFNIEVNKGGTMYYLALSKGSTAPTQEQIIAGLNSENEIVLNAGNEPTFKCCDNRPRIGGLSYNSEYDFYFVISDIYGVTASAVLQAATGNPIDFNENYPEIVQENPESIKISLSVDRTANIYYLTLPLGENAPTQEEVLLSENHFNINNDQEAYIVVDGLTFNSEYTVYIVAEDHLKESTTFDSLSVTTAEPIKYIEEPIITYVGANRVRFDMNLSNQAQLYSVVLSEDKALTLDEVLSFQNSGTSVQDIPLFNETIEVEISQDIIPSETQYLTLVAVDYDNYATEIKRYEITALDAIAFVEDHYPKAVSYRANEIQLSGMVTRDARLYYSIFEGEVEVIWPSIIILKEGFDGNGNKASITDSVSISANNLFEIDVLDLKENTKYQIILFAEDEDQLRAEDFLNIEDLSFITGLDYQDFSREELSISPNPMKDHLSIDFMGNEQYQIHITSLKGQSVFTKSNLFGSQDINLSELQKGVYFINVQTKDKSSWKRFVKE